MTTRQRPDQYVLWFAAAIGLMLPLAAHASIRSPETNRQISIILNSTAALNLIFLPSILAASVYVVYALIKFFASVRGHDGRRIHRSTNRLVIGVSAVAVLVSIYLLAALPLQQAYAQFNR